MQVLDGLTGLADREMAVLLSAEPRALLVKKDLSDHNEGPEAENGVYRQQRVMVQAEQVLTVFKEALNLPAHGNVLNQGQQVSGQITGCPETKRLGWAIQAGAADDQLTTLQLANTGRADMDEDGFMLPVRPGDLLISRGW